MRRAVVAVRHIVSRSSAAQILDNLLERAAMKLAGFFLLLSGWGIVVATLPLLPSLPMRAGFVLGGLAVEVTGLILVVRSHLVPKG